MASEQRLYTFTPDLKDELRKFRLGTSRSSTPQARIYEVDKKTLHVQRQKASDTYTSLDDLAEDLPDNSPRFILISYPTTTADGRVKVPYVLLSYMPTTSSSDARMLYAGARELMRSESEAGRMIEVEDEDDVRQLEEKLNEE